MALSPSIIAAIRSDLAAGNGTHADIARRRGCSPRKVAQIAAGITPALASPAMLAALAYNAQGYTDSEIARLTDRSRSSVGRTLARARARGFHVKDNSR